MIGFTGMIILMRGANIIANTFLQIPEAELTLVVLSPSIFFVSIISVIRGYFNGLNDMNAMAKSQALEQLFKTIFTVLIVEVIAIISKTDVTIMAAGANFATTLATIVSFLYLYYYYKIKRTEIKTEQEYKEQKGDSVGHFYDKMLKLKNLLNTETAKKVALNRHVYMEKFLEEFYKEWNGEL